MEEKNIVELLDAIGKLHSKLFEQEERLKSLEKFLPAATFTYETIKELQSIVDRDLGSEATEIPQKVTVSERLKNFTGMLGIWAGMVGVVTCIGGIVFALQRFLLPYLPFGSSLIATIFRGLGSPPGVFVKYFYLGFGITINVLTLVFYLVTRTSRSVLASMVALSAVFYMAFLEVQYSGNTLIFALQGYAATLFILSFITHFSILRLLSCGVWLGSMVHFIQSLMAYSGDKIVLYRDGAVMLGTMGASFIVLSQMAHRYKNSLGQREQFVPYALEVGAALLGLYWLNTPLWQFSANALPCGLYGLALIAIGTLYARKALLVLGFFALIEGIYLFGIYYWSSFSLATVVQCGYLFGAFSLIFFVLYGFFARMVRFKAGLLELWGLRVSQGALFVSLFLWLRMYILAVADHYYTSYIIADTKRLFYMVPDAFKYDMATCMLTLYYGFCAALLLISSAVWRKAYVRYVGFTLLGVACIDLVFIVWSLMYTTQKVVTFLIERSLV